MSVRFLNLRFAVLKTLNKQMDGSYLRRNFICLFNFQTNLDQVMGDINHKLNYNET